jgi:hypothetical protein
VTLDAAQKRDIIDRFRQHESDTGSTEVQVAILSERISYLTDQTGGSAAAPPELPQEQGYRAISDVD